MQVGDVVLIQYEGKCKPATYRLGIFIGVEVDADGLVRTVLVEYSLLSELSESERLSYKGITKKRLRVPVQRLVLILPVEERDHHLPGGQADQDPAPLEEVCEKVNKANSYDVVWFPSEKVYKRKHESDHGGRDVQGLEGGGDEAKVGQEEQVKEVVRNQDQDGENSSRQEFKTCEAIKGQLKCEDFEKQIYEVKAKDFFEI